MAEFKKKFSFDQRKKESDRIKQIYLNRVPVVIEKSSIILDKYKFLVPYESKIYEFMEILRKRIDIKSHQGLFLFINNTIPNMTKSIGEIYNEHKNEDGFLYINLILETTFGN